jgi:hypothetical protein
MIKVVYNDLKEVCKAKRFAVKDKDKNKFKELCLKEREIRRKLYSLLDEMEE